MDRSTQNLRRHALQKIAELSAPGPDVAAKHSDFTRLCSACPSRFHQNGSTNGPKPKSSGSARLPMTLSELDVLFSLCKAGPRLENEEVARRFIGQIYPYLLEAHVQSITPSPFLPRIEPSPWEALSYHLTSAILAVGVKYPSLHATAHDCTVRYVRNCLSVIKAKIAMKYDSNEDDEEVEIEEILEIASISASLLGFLEAASLHTQFYSISERVDLISLLRLVLSEGFMVSAEGAFSSIRTADESSKDILIWKTYTKRYAASGRPLGAMVLQRAFMRFLVSCSSLQIATPEQLQATDILDLLISGAELDYDAADPSSAALVEALAEIAKEEIRLLEDGADYLELGSAWQQRLAFAVKAYALTIFLSCMIADEDTADAETLMSWLEDTIADPTQMADPNLACTVLRSMAVAAKFSSSIASSLSRSLPRFIVQGGIQGEVVKVAAHSLTYILQLVSQDAVITCLYSLGNVLSARSKSEKMQESALGVVPIAGKLSHHSSGSAISLVISGEEETALVYGIIVRAIVSVAASCQDEKITALALSILLQKLGRVGLALDLHIITEAPALVACSGPLELKSLLKLYSKVGHDAAVQDNLTLLEAVTKARIYLSKSIRQESPLFKIYLVHLLESIISKGDVPESENNHQTDVELAAREIIQLLKPLTHLISAGACQSLLKQDENIARLFRDTWFNIIVHGITPVSKYGRFYSEDLRNFARESVPLVAEDRTDQFESEIELNTVLRRGMNAPHTAEQKRSLISLLPQCESDIRGLSYPKLLFLSATYFLESTRAETGTFNHMLTYFRDPSLDGSAMANCMVAIAEGVLNTYLKRALKGRYQDTSAPLVAKQLALVLAACCHRIPRVQQIATTCADRIITQIPSSLCQRTSLFALLELLTIMWTSCLEAEIDAYDWKSRFTSARGEVSLEMSDDYELRRSTLGNFHRQAKIWLGGIISIAPLDIKGLLQTYLSDYHDEGAYGHVALGRSFALDMGSLIPLADHKLGAIERHGDWNPNTASDFIAQYTTRQEYKYADVLPDYDQGPSNILHPNGDGIDDTVDASKRLENDQAILALLERRTLEKNFASIGELRDVLRRAAALLCRAKADHCAVVHHLVSIPFTIFTNHSIKLGVSLWLGVVNENPRLESTILTEIAQNWEVTVRNRMGAFSEKLCHVDPFFVQEEFAPSDKSMLIKRQQAAHNLIAPHLRILQFLASHFNATRLGSIHTQRIFYRLATITLKGLKASKAHPLAREMHFRTVLFGLNILRYCTGLDQPGQWRLKDTILSGGLSWFSHHPRWSFGGNRLSLKAEIRLMTDVSTALRGLEAIGLGSIGALKSLAAKHDLLLSLLDNEQMRLEVWLWPLDHEKRHFFPSANSSKLSQEANLLRLLECAWLEDSSLAIHFPTRYRSPRLADEVRLLLMSFPERATAEPDALKVLLGNSLPSDVTVQMKYLLYWKPVNPVTAVTYFLPEYKNHPFIIQYAMRALESHSVDVTFFYVPQIVQTLRYDTLGYVQRYIIETAKFSQLFAHQIIWNMKANAFKDEDSSIEDELKPTLDLVTDNMIQSFSQNDKAFYEREFSFFNEITDISGKLRPFIKRSKPEKKQKIEEELRKIKVEVGVYLPSNPDGIVIGIDRKSGKPLQSHAKAPYMATFRIKKKRTDIEGTAQMLERTNANFEAGRRIPVPQDNTYEVWQSAIFKVGDDCRQDVLALQLIAAFRGIFNNVGLDVYVYPYRVTATAPGCGVIDVLPNSISRDMLGREAVNGLCDYFESKYGAQSSIRFQEARNNFVKSMAAYSVISYLLQFKDRHNGNIMIDDAGHILHIDFGFCFDIAPGGIRFERAPFKLTSEMVAVMGGSTTSQSYRWFEELCVKSFLASRQHTKELCDIVALMLGSGLPCFKPYTITHLRERFVLEKSEREAAEFMKDLVKKSYSSYSTKKYDQFQLLTNGIPY